MKKAIIFGLSCAVMLMLFGADVGEKFQVYYWNNYYWAKARMPDGTVAELKDPNDLTYLQWKAKFIKHWQDSQNPPDPNYPVLYDNIVYTIYEKDANEPLLLLHWKPDDQKIEINQAKLKALKVAVVQMDIKLNP